MKDEDVHYWRKRCEMLLSANIELKAKNQELEKTVKEADNIAEWNKVAADNNIFCVQQRDAHIDILLQKIDSLEQKVYMAKAQEDIVEG